MAKKLNVYFPVNNLNPQGWISEFITPIIVKTGKNKDELSTLFYNSSFPTNNEAGINTIISLKKVFKDDSFQNFLSLRQKNEKEKLLYLNGNFLDLFEVDETLKDSSLDDVEFKKYTLFMSNIKPYQAAFLQSYIKLSYGFRENTKQPFKFIDFPFTQKFDLDFILNNKSARSEGSGIVDVSVNNKFNLATHINSEININYFFGNLKYLTQEITENGSPLAPGQKSPSPYGFSFTKLIANLDTSREIIRLEYGRRVAKGFETVVKDSDLKGIIERREKKVYLLNKFQHTFNFDERGNISLGASYYNFHDASLFEANNIAVPSYTKENIGVLRLEEKYGNILKKYDEGKKQVKELEDLLKDAKQKKEAPIVDKSASQQSDQTIDEITKSLAKLNKNLNILKRSIKSDLTTVFLDKIKEQGQLFGIKFNTNKNGDNFSIKTKVFLVNPTFKNSKNDFLDIFTYETEYNRDQFKNNSKIKEFFKSDGQNLEDLLTRTLARIFNSPYNEESNNKTYGQIMFFPLKALFSAAYSFLSEEEQNSLPTFLFGNVLMKVGDSVCSINVGDLLVETGVFQKWYYNSYYKKDKLEYSFGTFIQDLAKELMPEILYRNRVGFDDKAPISAVKLNQYYLKGKVSKDIRNSVYLDDNIENLKSLSNLISKRPSENLSPLIYVGQLTNLTTQIGSPLFSKYGNVYFNFNEQQDAERGIMHIKVGADGGMLTGVGFNAQDFQKIRTALALESLADKASRYFFFYYSISLEMLGNNMFNYDSVVCVPSTPLGIDTEENDIGIAGYYKVKETRDSISESGEYRTSAQADWIYNPKNSSREKQKITSAPTRKGRIGDSLPESVTNPINYIIEFLENDPSTIINSQLKNFAKPEEKTEEKGKSDNSPKQEPAKNLDKKEFKKKPKQVKG